MTATSTERTTLQDIAVTESAARAVYFLDHHLISNRDIISASPPDGGKTNREVGDNLYNTFLGIYRYVHRDHKQCTDTKESWQAENTAKLKGEDLQYLSTLFHKFADTYYDRHGQMKQGIRNHFAQATAELYNTLVTNERSPLSHAEFALGVLLTEIGRGEKGKEIFPYGVDFSRADASQKDMGKRAEEAIFPKELNAPAARWANPPSSFVTIGGLRFLSYKVFDKECLVTQTGRLVLCSRETTAKITQHLDSGRNPDTVPVNLPTSTLYLGSCIKTTLPAIPIIDVEHPKAPGDTLVITRPFQKPTLSPVQELKMKLIDLPAKDTIDGRKTAGCDNKLVCLDVDLLTGLRMDGENSELTRFMRFLSENHMQDFTDFYPPGITDNTEINPTKKESIQNQIKQNVHKKIEDLKKHASPDILALIEKAEPNLCLQLPRIRAITDKEFVLTIKNGAEETVALKEPPATSPNAYSSGGGSASHKTFTLKAACEELGEKRAKHLVVASLDAVRRKCDQFWLFLGANHHGDDYKRFEQFGKTIRALTTKRAREGKFDFFLDGTGSPFKGTDIPFKGKYDQILKSFKQAGYKTTVLAAAAPLYVHNPKKRATLEKQGRTIDDSMGRAWARFAEKLRAVIPQVSMSTHKDFPVSTSDAMRNKYVDRHIMFDALAEPGKERIIAYAANMDANTLHALYGKKDAELNKTLTKILDTNWPIAEAWKKYLHTPQKHYSSDFKVLRANSDGSYRTEIITDMDKYRGIAMLEKGLTLHKGAYAHLHTLAFDMAGHMQSPEQPGLLQVHNPKKLHTIPDIKPGGADIGSAGGIPGRP